jgi:sporulation integral membrane protein YtvI
VQIIVTYLSTNSKTYSEIIWEGEKIVVQTTLQRVIFMIAVCGLLFFGGKYILPLIFPFLLGFLLAYMAEPAVKRLSKPVGRGLAAGICVSGELVLILFLLALMGGLLVRQMGRVTAILPDLEAAVAESSQTLETFLLNLAAKAPAGLRHLLTRGILGLFDGGGVLVETGLGRLPRMIGGVLSHLPGGAVTVCTAILSAFLISARMPKLAQLLPESWKERVLTPLRNIKTGILGWLKAQVKLAGLTFLVCLGGLMLTGVSYAPLWAAVIALVDAVPLLGSGLILVPWSLIAFLQGAPGRGLGLLGTFAAAFLLRTAMEPKLVGKQIGLDPLATLVALYFGYRLGGFWGLVLSPILAVTAMELTKPTT